MNGASTYNCTNLVVNDATVRNYLCLKSGNQIIIRNFITVDTYIKTFVLNVSNVLNPSPGGQTSNFLATIGTDVAMPSYFSSVTLKANSFQACSASFG
jgi:hypothetical protein